jgi:hypothetical protein
MKTATADSLNESVINQKDGKALEDFFGMHACGSDSTSCILDLSSDSSSSSQEFQDRIAHLRQLAETIFHIKEVQCGNPKILGKQIIASNTTDLEFCFWKNDFVSDEAMNGFSFEKEDWQWVVRAFQDPKVQQHHKCLAFLDVGVNVGDWASPITASLPTIAYFGIEGSPPTAAIAAANMLTTVRYHKYHEHITDLAPRALVPFPVMSHHSLQQAEKSGGVCFQLDAGNVGGQGVQALGTLNCDARATAGAAYLPDVLHNLFTQFQQPSCTVAVNQTRPLHQTNSHQHWPSIYIAKFDIQGFEFQALAPAIPWLEERPPCYMMLEFSNKARQNYALMELLVNVVGYDLVWRSSGLNMVVKDESVFYGQPPSTPHWSKQTTTTTGTGTGTGTGTSNELWAFYEQDMEGQVDWAYINYIVGFADQDACIQRLLGHSS